MNTHKLYMYICMNIYIYMHICYMVDTYYVGYVCVHLWTSLCSLLMLGYGNEGANLVKERHILKELCIQIYLWFIWSEDSYLSLPMHKEIK